MKALKIIVEKQVNTRELISLAKRNVRNPLKKYNSTKIKDKKLNQEEFDCVFDAIREILYVQGI